MDFHFNENLYKYWGSKQFREIKVYSDPIENNRTQIITQLDILNKIAENINLSIQNKGFRDIFITARTGMGKSVLFQLPAIDLHQNGFIVIVITPLIALMKDQVGKLKIKGINFATYINSEDTFLEREEKFKGIKEGKYSLIYVSPEFLVGFKNLSSFFNLNKDRRIGLYVIDEAHCVFTWGTGFRPDYWFLGKRLKNDWRIKEECNAPIVALTATAVNSGDFDSVSEIIEMLDLQINPKDDVKLSCIKREKIEINISKLEQDTSKSKKEDFVIKKLTNELKDKNKKAIIYHPYRRDAKQLSKKLSESGIKAGYFVGSDMFKDEKENVLKEFEEGKLNSIVATKAFGMGVDIKDIDFIYHYAINESLTEYTQEIGRAGRKDEIRAHALSDYHKKDLDYTKWLNKSSSLTQWQIREILKKILNIYMECHSYKSSKSILIYPDTFFNLIKRKDKNAINDIVNNIETALLLLEKDIFNKFGDQILYFDIPETTEVFCFARNEEISKLKTSPYFKCFQHLKDEANGIVFKLNLEEFGKKFSKNESLRYLKRNFFSGKLIEGIKIEPRIEIKANLIKEFEKSRSELEKILKKICDLALSFDNSTFKGEEFKDKFKEVFNTKEDTIAEIILSLFSFEQSQNSPEFNYCKFIRKNDYGKYRITGGKIKGFHDFIKTNFIELFKDQQIFHEYLPINRANQLKLIFGFLELFDIVNFQVKGSDNLAFKIFIKDPRKIDSLVDKYFNNELKKVETRKNEELLLIKKFCNEYKDSNQAWEFLENYFLGRYSYSSNDEIHSNLEDKNQEFYIKEPFPPKINLSDDQKSSPTEYSEGDIVNHERWGKGKVIEILPEKKSIIVDFEIVGKKKLDLSLAPITKIISEEDLIKPGTLVEIEDIDSKKRDTYLIAEVNTPLSEIDGETTISVDSPLGNELLGHKKGDIITIQLHTGKYKNYKIIEFVKM